MRSLFLNRSTFRNIFVLLTLGFAGLGQMVNSAQGVNVSWKVDGLVVSGNWNEVDHWTPGGGPPTLAGNSATIDLTGSPYSVAFNVNARIDAFTLNASNVTFSSTVSRTLNVSGPVNLQNGVVDWLSSTWTGGGTLSSDVGIMTFRGNCAVNNAAFVQNSVLSLIASGGSHSTTVANGDTFTNNNVIDITSETDHSMILAVSSGVMTNSPTGIIDFEIGAGGLRALNGSFSKQGIMNIKTDTNFNKTNGVFPTRICSKYSGAPP